ncbi:hypothetical protein DL93DRAFT_2073494 [Clavulina sp. PMI_390]|nr:hypothetical protein DL93DRAFT_2073494 [Clavulina sp. PMI_390]
MFTAIKALRNVKAESISPPLHPELASRSLGTASHTQIFTEEETTRFVKRCKEAKTTVTYAYIAILALAMQDLYADESKGIPSQVFAMPYNGRRWLPAGLSPAPPHSPSLGNSNAYIKVPHSGHALRFVASKSSENDKELRLALQAARVKRILEFGERYKENSLKILNSKTPDGVLASKTLVPLLVKAMEKSDPDKPTVSIFGVVSQGQLDKMFPSKANVEGSDIIVVNYQNGGRTVDSNPLMILYTWRGRMHVRYKWNSKYFAQKTFEDIDSKTLEYLKDFVEATI